MNERIEKLARKSGATVNEGYDGTKSFVYGITMSPEELEKFAELIVKECAEVARLTDPSDSDEYRSGRYWAGLDIKNHFGVAE